MTTIWQKTRHLTTKADIWNRPYDEERLKLPTRHLRYWRLRKVAGFLLLVDLMVVGFLVYSLNPLITLLCRNKELFGPRFVTSHDRNNTYERYQQDGIGIPRILHQTCATASVPKEWVYPQNTCRDAYSDFEYKLWTDDIARRFISSEYPWFLDTWDNYPFPIQRADAIRYFVLHHFGGIYLDMDTVCKRPFPIRDIEDEGGHYALFKSTRPTGVTNDFMISTAKHPAFTTTISKLRGFYKMTRWWAWFEPYTAVMLSTGPLFLTLAVKDYLLRQPSLPSPTVQIISTSEVKTYITDLESSTWHRHDTIVLKWMGERSWSWFILGVVGLIIGLRVLNRVLLLMCKALRGTMSITYTLKQRK